MEIGYWGCDRPSVIKADPGRWPATIDDGPWAPTYGHWYAQSPWKKEEPPADHPIRQIWDLWDATQVEPDEAKAQRPLPGDPQHPQGGARTSSASSARRSPR